MVDLIMQTLQVAIIRMFSEQPKEIMLKEIKYDGNGKSNRKYHEDNKLQIEKNQMEILKWKNTISEMKTSLEKPNNKFKLAKGRPYGEKCYQNGSTRVSTILPSKNTSVDTNRCECLHGRSRIQQESSRTLLRQKHPRLDPLKVMNGLILCVSLTAPLGWHSSVPADGQLVISSMGGSKSM